MWNTNLKVQLVNQKIKMNFKNIKGNGKIINHYKLLKNYVQLYVPIQWSGYLPYLPMHKHAKKSTYLFNAGFCQLMCIPSLIFEEYCVVA